MAQETNTSVVQSTTTPPVPNGNHQSAAAHDLTTQESIEPTTVPHHPVTNGNAINGITANGTVTNGTETPIRVTALESGKISDEPKTNGVHVTNGNSLKKETNGILINGDKKSDDKSEERVEEKVEVKTTETKTEEKSEDKTKGKAGDKTGDEDKSEVEKKEEKKYEPHGSICDIHKLYQTKPDESGNTSWTKDYPESLVAPAEDEESAQYALIVRNAKCYDGRKSLSVHSVIVQSDPLKKFLSKVLENYPGVTTTLERLEFHSPFRPLVHRWEQFVQFRDEEQDPTTKTHVNLLYKVLEEELRDDIARKKDMIRNGVITHALIWTIFEPGNEIIATAGGRTRAFKFHDDAVDCRTKAWIITGQYVDFDGEDFGYREEDFKIFPYIGTAPITSLAVSPLKYHAEKESIRESLITRGKLWESYKGYKYKAYEGVANGFFNDEIVKYHVNSRIIIDAEAFNIFHPTETVRVYGESDCPQELTETEWVTASPMVHGYSIKDKEWLQFYLDNSKEIEWNTKAFDSLVLPKGQEDFKDLILAFAKAQSKQLDNFDDIVQGKGRGIIMQLSGPPGVGKTLTAESVAEVMQVPLYSMSAGDLGISAERVERSLKDILRMVPKWGAVLLLDEADVFMEARTASDLMRNELVSIFLRMLEYYEGILFLTTNRAENIDPAFESRIHVALAYQDLDTTSRHMIWSQFIERTDNTEEFTSAQIDKLSLVDLNGRQIKNTLKTAGLLAWSQQAKLGYQHVQTVLNLRKNNAHKPTFYI
ncbi:AAA family ATPase [Penicillium verhagenii]|uniref:AAA family ATPase n=1 Tax=Penicillium verhagenii TaxID=1562060 RepID=UPI0025451801|nr:AAA family ATPase [Penicillium verhagenii]KAJ5935338.1 AAA family ATPase [Penicillium verhagenii]